MLNTTSEQTTRQTQVKINFAIQIKIQRNYEMLSKFSLSTLLKSRYKPQMEQIEFKVFIRVREKMRSRFFPTPSVHD